MGMMYRKKIFNILKRIYYVFDSLYFKPQILVSSFREIYTSPGEGMMAFCPGSFQCCAKKFTVCYDWGCPGGNCGLNIKSFSGEEDGTPITECPVNCSSFCDLWLRSWKNPLFPDKAAVEFETGNPVSNKRISYYSGLLTIYSDTDTKEEINIEIFDLLGNQIKSIQNVNLNKTQSIDVSNFHQGYYSVIIKSKEFTNAFKFIKY